MAADPGTASGGICDIPLLAGLCNAVGDTAASLVTAPFDYLGQSLAELSGFVFEGAWSVMTTTTMADFTGAGTVAVYNLIFGVAVVVMLGMALVQVIGGMIRRDPSALVHAAIGLGKAVLGSFVLLSLTAVALEIVDQLSIGIAQAAGTSLETLGAEIGLMLAGLTAAALAVPGATILILLFFGGLALTGAAILWLSLLVRTSLILVVAVLGPLALAGWAWEHTRAWVGRWLSFLVALIVSKLVMVVIALMAVTQLGSPLEVDLASLSEPLTGIVLLLIAGFAPYLTFKLISFMGFDAYQATSMEQESKHALDRPLPLPSLNPGSARRVLDSGDAQPAGTGSTSPAQSATTSLPHASSAGTAESGGSAQSGAPATGTAASSAEPASASASTATGTSAGTGASASAETAATGTAAGGVAAGALVAAQALKDATEAGPALGAGLAGVAAQNASAAEPGPQAPPPPRTPPVPPAPPREGAS